MANLAALDPQLNLKTLSCRAIVETMQGNRSKYDYDVESGLFKLAAVLPAGMAFPLSFGFIPGTLAGDGDPLDVLVLGDEPLPVGVLVEVKVLGVIEAEQTENGETVRNDRVIAKVAQSHAWADITAAAQLGRAFTDDLAQFFETYNQLRGRIFALKTVAGPKQACALIRRAVKARA